MRDASIIQDKYFLMVFLKLHFVNLEIDSKVPQRKKVEFAFACYFKIFIYVFTKEKFSNFTSRYFERLKCSGRSTHNTSGGLLLLRVFVSKTQSLFMGNTTTVHRSRSAPNLTAQTKQVNRYDLYFVFNGEKIGFERITFTNSKSTQFLFFTIFDMMYARITPHRRKRKQISFELSEVSKLYLQCTKLELTGTVPSPRYAHTMIAIGIVSLFDFVDF